MPVRRLIVVSDVVRPTPSRGVLFFRGATRACAVCGQRGLTRGVIDLCPECPRCGFVFERHPGHFVGAVMMNTIITFGAILITFLASLWVLWPDVNFLGLAAVPFLIVLIVPAFFTPTFKTLWVAIDLMMNPLEPGEAPRGFVGVDAEEGTPQEG